MATSSSSTELSPVVSFCKGRQDELARARGPQNLCWQELRDLVRPATSDFYGSSNTQPNEQGRYMYDGTAPWCLEQLASGLHSHLTSPVDRFFGLGIAGMTTEEIPEDGKRWLEQCADEIYTRYNHPSSYFHPSMHEAYMDVGGLGTTCVYPHYDMARDHVIFRTYPMADIWMDEGADGVVNTVHRKIVWTKRQLLAEFPDVAEHEKIKRAQDNEKFTVMHCVYPNSDYNPQRRDRRSRKYKSVYFVCEHDILLEESGLSELRYLTPRWSKLCGEVYGRGPAHSVLPEIRMANAMRATIIKCAQKQVDPPLMVPDEGFLLPIRQVPGALNYYRNGAGEIQPLLSGGRVDIGEAEIEQSRQVIRQGFYVDWLVRSRKNERQTAQEIIDERNQMLSMMGPVIGRLQGELIGRCIEITFNDLLTAGRLPPIPASIDGAALEVVYSSPAARAQFASKGQGVQAFLTQLTQLLPVMPEATDEINNAGLFSTLADVTDVTRRVLNSPEEAAQKREKREQAQQQAQMAQLAPAVGKTAKDLAQAKQAGLDLGGMMGGM